MDRPLRLWISRLGCLWPAIGAVAGVTAVLLFAFVGAASRPGRLAQNPAPPTLIRLAAPTPTLTPPPSTPLPATATPVVPAGPLAEVSRGDLVEVFGTDGDGVRLRSAPSLDGVINGLGLDNEVFEVREGPVEAAGFVWWYLVNPYNTERQGWAVATYLRPLPGY